MKLRRSLSMLLALCLMLGLAACGKAPEPTPTTQADVATQAPETTSPPPPDYPALYAQALQTLLDSPSLTVELELAEERTVGTDTFSNTVTGTTQYQDLDGDKPLVRASSLVVSGTFRAAYEQLWADGVLFAKVKESRYYTRESLEDFLDTLLPIDLVDPDHYETVTAGEDSICFSQPKAPEPWAMPEDGELLEATATVHLAGEQISAVDYEITFLFGGSTIHNLYRAVYTSGVEEDLSALVPANTKGYESLDSIEASLLLYRARMALEQACVYSLTSTATLYAEAAAVVQIQSSNLHAYSFGEEYRLREAAQYAWVNLEDQSTEKSTYSYLYGDGVSTEQFDEEEPEVVTEADREAQEKGLQGYADRLKTNLFPNYNSLVDARLYDLGDYYLAEFSGNESFAETLQRYANQELFQDQFLLDGYSTAYAVKTITGYVALEKYTYLPTSLSISYEGIYTIQGQPTSLQLSLTCAISLYDPDTYEEITESPLPDQPQESPITPLFYEVTGKEGEKLYLFGTIHVGDDRTGFLPQVIYDAFDSADALAVEFDDAAFTQSLAEDQELQAQVTGSYFYNDGTSIANHIDSELYEAAVYLMKATGHYGATSSDRLKPFVWSQLIDSFYLSQGRRLTASKGVDNRLMARAREQEKEILSVESGESQIEMLSGYSDRVQEMLLGQSVSASRNQALKGTYALYELWCQGDEAALKEKVALMTEEERAEIDEDDLAVYDEFHQKMEVERNAAMVDTARSYLEGDKTVFFAVGLAHLLGEQGLVEGLREAGYTVTRVDTAG